MVSPNGVKEPPSGHEVNAILNRHIVHALYLLSIIFVTSACKLVD